MAEFDFIIIGAGSAGCVLANRLSEDSGSKVLLIEAGGSDAHPILRLPLAAGLAYFHKPTNWGYATTPQYGLNGREIAWPRGKVLGGCSSINGMMYMRGNRRDYDDWRQMGLAGWGYRDVLPYFKRSEDHADRDGPYHGKAGPLRVVTAKAQNPLYDDFLKAAKAAGHPRVDDHNGPDQEGLGPYDFNIRDGRRESSATAFLRPIKGRPNLTIWKNTRVERLMLEGKHVTGVTAWRPAGRETVAARREVVLAAGTINTPQILELSGIGDPETLKAAGIEVAHALPEVGENLQEHLGVYLTYRCKDPITLYGLMRPDRALWAGIRAYVMGEGPASAVPLEVGGFLRTRPDVDRPDIHITFVPGLNLETTQSGQGQHGYLINFYQLRPVSRGYVHVSSDRPSQPPMIDAGYLSDPSDLECFRGGYRLAQRIGTQSPLADRNAGMISPEKVLETDAEIDAWLRSAANTIFHPVGTARMGADEGSVVDEALRVRGLDGLRIADASVMPRIIGGNTSAPTMMIAEKSADMMLGRAPLPAFDPEEEKEGANA
ncbi:MAG: choline dehydrogenase [Rhodobacter sp.]|nr:choline dehydrogenase [Rhodobacter sp.]MCY4169507.1 choline dehydrogenase [Rhodobacter sp.]